MHWISIACAALRALALLNALAAPALPLTPSKGCNLKLSHANRPQSN